MAAAPTVARAVRAPIRNICPTFSPPSITFGVPADHLGFPLGVWESGFTIALILTMSSGMILKDSIESLMIASGLLSARMRA